MASNTQSLNDADIVRLTSEIDRLVQAKLTPMQHELQGSGIMADVMSEQLTMLQDGLNELRRSMAAGGQAASASATGAVNVGDIAAQVVALIRSELNPALACASAAAAPDQLVKPDEKRRREIEDRIAELQLALDPARKRSECILQHQQTLAGIAPKIAEYEAKLPNRIYEIGLKKFRENEAYCKQQIELLKRSGPSAREVEEELLRLQKELNGIRMTSRELTHQFRQASLGMRDAPPQSANMLNALLKLMQEMQGDHQDIEARLMKLQHSVTQAAEEVRKRQMN